MNFRYIKILMIALALVFVTQGCAVVVRDRDYDHHYRYHHRGWRSSVEQSTLSIAQSVGQNGEYSGHQQQVAR